MTEKKKVLVVGAGITGCTIARLFAEKGYKVHICDSSSNIGGACADELTYSSYHQIYGSHIFHTNNKVVWDFLSRFTDWSPYQHKVKALIDGDLVPIPFNLNSLEYINPRDKQILIQYLEDNYAYGTEFTLAELLDSNDNIFYSLGQYIFTHIFRDYSEKQWGKVPDDSILDRVKAFRYSKDNRYFLDEFQGIPVDGFSEMFERMISHKNITYGLDCYVDSIPQDSIVIWTGSIDQLHDYCYGELSYRTCEFDKISTRAARSQEVAVINYPNDYSFTRTHDYSHYLHGVESHVVAEYPKDYDRLEDLMPFYPINDTENTRLYSKYFELTKQKYPNVIFAGRLGTYKYLNMDKAVENAMHLNEVFEEIIKIRELQLPE